MQVRRGDLMTSFGRLGFRGIVRAKKGRVYRESN